MPKEASGRLREATPDRPTIGLNSSVDSEDSFLLDPIGIIRASNNQLELRVRSVTMLLALLLVGRPPDARDARATAPARRERALAYKTLVLTDLRQGELASITVGQVDLRRLAPLRPLPPALPVLAESDQCQRKTAGGIVCHRRL